MPINCSPLHEIIILHCVNENLRRSIFNGVVFIISTMAQSLPELNRIDEFKLWALKLGCPVKALPEKALNRFVKANGDKIKMLMDRVMDRNDVKSFQDNSLLQDFSPVVLEKFPAKNISNLKKVEKLNAKLCELRPRVERQKCEMEELKSSLEKKAEQIKVLKQTHSDIQCKSIQFEQKYSQLAEKIDEERKFEAMVVDVLPVPVNDATERKNEAEHAVKKLVEMLRNAYKEIGDREFTEAETEKVEEEMRKVLAGIPVVTIFKAIKYCNGKNISDLNQLLVSTQIAPTNVSGQSTFDISITKARISIYKYIQQTKRLKEEHASRLEQYVQLYDEFSANMIDKMRSFNGPDTELYDESLCNDYLKGFGTSMFNLALLQFHKEKLETVKQMATERDGLLKGNELMEREVMETYAKIETTYNSVLDDAGILSDVKESIKQIHALSKYKMNSFGNRRAPNTSATFLNSTLGSTAPSLTVNSNPAHYLKELSMLAAIPCEKWNQLPWPISMDLGYNKSIFPIHSLLTPNAVLKELNRKSMWYKAIGPLISDSLVVNESMPQFADAESVASTLKDETSKMLAILEDIKFMYARGQTTVTDTRRYLEFLLDTSLGSNIPQRLMINRRTFQDYEEEFLSICSLISNSLKKQVGKKM